MKIEDVLAANPVITNADQLRDQTDLILCSEDVSDNERAAFITGYIAGIGYATAKIIDGKAEDVKAEITVHLAEWQARGWI